MKLSLLILFAFFITNLSGCGASTVANNQVTVAKTPSSVIINPAPTTEQSSDKIANAEYPATGVVTKINLDANSIEINHDEIVGVMPAMKMEFKVRDKALLKDIEIGDKIDFTLEYLNRNESITMIEKVK